MIDTTDRNAAGEYSRMFGVLAAGFGLVCSVGQLATSSHAMWLMGLSIVAGLRSLGPVGTGAVRSLFTIAVTISLAIAFFAFQASFAGVIVAAMLFLVAARIATEIPPAG